MSHTFHVGDIVELKRASPGICTGVVVEHGGELCLEFRNDAGTVIGWRALDHIVRHDEPVLLECSHNPPDLGIAISDKSGVGEQLS